MFRRSIACLVTVVSCLALAGCGQSVVCSRAYIRSSDTYMIAYQKDNGGGRETVEDRVSEAEYQVCQIGDPYPSCKRGAAKWKKLDRQNAGTVHFRFIWAGQRVFHIRETVAGKVYNHTVGSRQDHGGSYITIPPIRVLPGDRAQIITSAFDGVPKKGGKVTGVNICQVWFTDGSGRSVMLDYTNTQGSLCKASGVVPE